MKEKNSSIRFGPGAPTLILILVVLTMSVLGMLSLMTSRADLRLSQRSAEVIEQVFQLNARAEERRAAIDAELAACTLLANSDEEYVVLLEQSLPQDILLEGRLVCWSETDGSRTLDCALEVLPWGSEERAHWVRHDLTAQTEEIWN